MNVKLIALFTCGILPFMCVGQTNDFTAMYRQADQFRKEGKTEDAYHLYQQIYPKMPETDTLLDYVIWYYLNSTTELEQNNRKNEKFEASLKYGLEALALIQKHKESFNQKFADREAWMIKNIAVSYSGLGMLKEAKEYRDELYKRYKADKLPEGIDGYFNFDFFKLNGKNIWGYEWYPELPENRFRSSFTKIVYYVYSTDSSGSDKDQLYRFHVLMFHQDSNEAPFDYILEKQQDTADATICGSYYYFTYKKDIDYRKLKADIKKIVVEGIEPDSRRIVGRRE